jgi:ATP-dependent metalloprotease
MQKSIKHTAYHEAGHALVALFTPGADPLHKATINPRGPALGLTWQMPPADEYSRSLTQLRASVDVCMGGQVAETLVFGADEVGAGATSDIKQATNIARHMVCDCGFSDAIGPMHVDESSSQATQQAADREVCAHGTFTLVNNGF